MSLDSTIFDSRLGREDTKSWIWEERESSDSLNAKGVEECDFFLGEEAEDKCSRRLLFMSFLSLDRSLDLSLDLKEEEDRAVEGLEVGGNWRGWYNR